MKFFQTSLTSPRKKYIELLIYSIFFVILHYMYKSAGLSSLATIFTLLFCVLGLKVHIYRYIVLTLFFTLSIILLINFHTVNIMGFQLYDILPDLFAILLDSNSNEIWSTLNNISTKKEIATICMLIFFLGMLIYIRPVYSNKSKVYLLLSILSLIILIFMPGFIVQKLKNGVQHTIHMYQENKDNIIKKQQFYWNSKSLYPEKDTVVLILGETTRGDKLGINGYDRNTTPLLSQYDIISYDNTISNAAYTLLSTPIILTRSRGESKSSIYPEKSIISAFKEAGYYTYYITYLNKVHIGDNAINQIVNEVDTYMQSDWDRAKNENLPIDIVGSDIVSEIIKDDHHHKKLIIYKIVGSHYNFHERYTKKYNIFTPSHLDIEYNGPKIEEKEVLHNSYDNTILVTDEAVANILDTLMHVPGRSSLTFISDHGISIFEDNKSAYGGPTPYNYNIPLFFWLKQNNFDERKTSYLKKYQHEKIDSICFLDTFLSIHDIITPYKKGCDLTTNITLPHKRNVILQDKIVDFDEYFKNFSEK